MPHSRLDDLPNGGDRWPAIGREGYKTVKWGDMEVALTTLSAPLDCTHQYKEGGLPGGVCPCSHYGYVFEGGMRAVYRIGPTRWWRPAKLISSRRDTC